MGRNVMDFVHPEDLPHVQQEFDNFIQQKTKNPKVTYRYRCVDGSYLWFETLGTIITDQKGKPKEILFNTRDITEQKQFEEQLSIFKTISDKALYGLAMSDSEGKLTYINPYFAKVHGYTPEELQGKHMSILHLEKQLPAVKKTLDEMNETGLFKPQEIWHAKKDGSEFPMLMSGVRFEKRFSVPEFYATSAIDISQQKKQQEELSRQNKEMEAMNEELFNLNYKMELSNKRIKASEEKLSSLFQSMTEHVVLHELVFNKHGTPVNYRILECNRRFIEVTGITAEQAVGKLATEVYGTTIPPYLDVYASVAMNGTSHHFETFFPPMDKYFSISAVSMGKNRFATITTDITEQKQHQFETERLKEQYELAVAGTNDGIWDWNILTNELFLSKRWKEMLGYEDWEIKNKFNSFISLIYEEDVPKVNDYVQRYLKGEIEQYTMEFRMKHKNGSLVWILAKGEALRDENGKPYRMAGSHSDITERKEMEEKLIHAKEEAEAGNKAKSVFLANMNHELRTPLNGIIGFSDILRNMPLDEEQKQFVDIVNTSGKHLADIISDILDFSRIEAGKFELNTEKTEVKPLIENTLSMVRPKAEGKGLCLSSSIEDTVPETVEVDSSRLRQVLLNLIANAVKFTDEGSVSVSVSLLERQQDQARLLFKITDTGMGIKEGEQKKIFEPFHQAEMSVDKKSQGTGLGLSISKKILELMGTSLELESEYGKGSTFSFELVLPYEKEHSVDSNKINTENTQVLKELTNKKILIAEDNPVNMQYAQTAIAMLSKDIHIIQAQDGKEAYQLYREHTPDLILMDIRMPKLDGYQATKMIRAHDENIPIIALTAKASINDKEDCLRAGMDDYITKPVSLEVLKKTVGKYLRVEK